MYKTVLHLKQVSLTKLAKIVLASLICSKLCLSFFSNFAAASNLKHNQAVNQGIVYPQFRDSSGRIVRWLPEQMPLKVYVAHGQTMENIIDPNMGVAAFNVDNLGAWPDFAAQIIENQPQLAQLPVAPGYLPEHYQAVITGISEWKMFEKEGLFSFVFTDDPSDADIYVFWVSHFIDKHGFGLLANDIRGLTAKYSNWYKAILENKPIKLKPVVALLRTTNQQGNPMDLGQMQASAAHEFGHALGIDQHSTNPHDLMSLYYGNGTISSNDAATIRYLYHLTPDLVP